MRSIEYKDIDRVPLLYRADDVVNKKIMEAYRLKDYSEIIRRYDSDAISVPVIRSSKYYGETYEDGTYSDFYGNRMKHVKYGDVTSYAVVKSVLEDAHSIDDIEKVRWPGSDYVDIEESVKRAQDAHSSGLAVYGGMWASLFTTSRSIMGEENFLISLIEQPEVVSALIERLSEFYMSVNEAYFQACRKYIDIFYFGSDFGTQTSMFISPDMFRQFFKPSFKRIIDHARGFGLKVMYHTCGAISDIIPDLIDCGVDILDPVQVSASNMEPSLLAQKFKNKICFHGGISTQTTLPFGKPEDVQAEVTRAIEALGPLGYIAAPDQDMIGDIPVENIEMMFKTIREYKIGD
jgi:uroporphyrinogen decarboxylase